MKSTTIIFLATLLSTHAFAKPLKRQAVSAAQNPGASAAEASFMAAYSSENAVVLDGQTSLIELQATWQGGAVPTASGVPLATGSGSAPAVNTATAGLAGGDQVHAFQPGNGNGNTAATSTTAIAPVIATTAPVVQSTTATSIDTAVVPGSTSSSASGAGSTGTAGAGSTGSNGSCTSSSPCTGPATPEGPDETGNACVNTTTNHFTDWAVALPQWLYDTNEADGISPLCGQMITVIGVDGKHYGATVIDKDGLGGGQDVQYWLDMSNPLYEATTGNPAAGCSNCAPGVYPQVQWYVGAPTQ